MNKIGIIITTFMRDELLFKSIESLLANWQDNFELIIVDQGNEPDNLTYKKIFFSSLTAKRKQYIWERVPFDSGLSYCRNYGVQKANELGCDYVIIGSDSFLFNESIKNINKLLDTDFDIIGFELSGCVCDWEAILNLIKEESFELNFIAKPTVGGEIEIYHCDIMRNFFLAKTNSLLDVQWDNNLKLGEHEDFFWRFKQTGYKCGWTDYIHAEKMKDRPDEYANMRRKNFNEGLAYLRKKYNMSGWVTYKNLDRAKRSK